MSNYELESSNLYCTLGSAKKKKVGGKEHFYDATEIVEFIFFKKIANEHIILHMYRRHKL